MTQEFLKQRPLHVKVVAGIERHLRQHGLDGLSLLVAGAAPHHIRPGEAASPNPDEPPDVGGPDGDVNHLISVTRA